MRSSRASPKPLILFQMITGKLPFEAASVLDAMRQTIEKEAPSPRLLNPYVGAELAAVCRKCLEKAPDDRYQTAQALGDDLHRWLEGEPVSARRGPHFMETVRYLSSIWDTENGKRVHDLVSKNNWVVCLDFSPDGRLLASGEGNSAVRLWEVSSGRQIRVFGMGDQSSSEYTYSVSFDPTGRWLAYGSARSAVVVWKVP